MPRFFLFNLVLAIMIASPVGAAVPTATSTTSTNGQALPRATAPVKPVQLRIGAIKLNESLLPVGLDRQGRPVAPKHKVGWYMHSARPGQGENVVLWGHVLRWKDAPRVPAPFERLKDVKLGAEVSVVMSNRRAYRYRVTRKVWARPNMVQFILPTGSERLTLVSCVGKNVVANGELTKEFRLIIAEPMR